MEFVMLWNVIHQYWRSYRAIVLHIWSHFKHLVFPLERHYWPKLALVSLHLHICTLNFVKYYFFEICFHHASQKDQYTLPILLFFTSYFKRKFFKRCHAKDFLSCSNLFKSPCWFLYTAVRTYISNSIFWRQCSHHSTRETGVTRSGFLWHIPSSFRVNAVLAGKIFGSQ